MDAFVNSLFQGIDIPEDLNDLENVAGTPVTCPSSDHLQAKRNTDFSLNQHSDSNTQCITAKNTESRLQSSSTVKKLVISAGLSHLGLNKRLYHDRYGGDITSPFVSPAICQPASQDSPKSHKKRITYPEHPPISSGYIHNTPIKVEDDKKTIAERYPLKGPAGVNVLSILGNVMISGVSDAPNNINREGNSWMRAMSILDTSDICCEIRKQKDFPQDFSISEYITQKFNIKWIISESHVYRFGFRMDWLVVYIVSQKTMGMHVMCVLMDKSGQMLGCMSEELHTKLKHVVPGCTFILKNVFIYNPVGYMPYVIIRQGDVMKVVRNKS
ncbi:hypothetical protein BgAZ_101750 [Babesia gibsoni]|uniref:Homologous recombination OB-fold protein OB-fold domain-containing protein n=1 Tax=Babesia gibsoni TaxID=33632 RepID=A0AAD8UVC9_BABGI|nr:hypothetical protein BgAZ_101750 [Babesia gibsoni]